MIREYTTFEVLCEKFKIIYKDYHLKDGEAGVTKEMFKIVPKEGYKLYRIKATYAKNLRASSYYCIAKSIKDAKAEFKLRFSWLNLIKSVEMINGKEADEILSDPLHRYIF